VSSDVLDELYLPKKKDLVNAIRPLPAGILWRCGRHCPRSCSRPAARSAIARLVLDLKPVDIVLLQHGESAGVLVGRLSPRSSAACVSCGR
jgi:hypothetical protein